MKKSTLHKIATTTLLLSFTASIFAASTITGYVKADATGDPLPGVNILIQGTSTGTTTNLSGQYSLNVTTGVTITLVCSPIGYSSISRTITPVTGTNYVNFWFNNPSPPTASISGTTSVCRNATSPNITFTGANGTAPYTFTYKINSGSNLTVTTTSGNSVTVSAPTTSDGYYTYSLVSVWDVNSTVSVSGSATVTVNALPATPTIAAGGATTFCSGSSVTLTSSAGTTYLWSNSATTSSINVTSSGSYTVRVTNSSGCQSAASSATVVTVNSLPATPSITAGGPTTFCSGGSVTLTSSAGTTYLWSNGATTPSLNSNSSGSYTVRITNSNGCQSAASAATVVTVNSLPGTPVTGTITQPTCNLQTGSVELNGLPSSGSWTLTRYPGEITTAGTGTTTTISDLQSGTYSFSVLNASGCTSIVSANVVINSQPGIPATPTIGIITQPTCNVPTGSVVLNGLPATGTWTITGSSGGYTKVDSGTGSTLSGLAAGTYSFTVTDASGCISLSTSNIEITTNASAPSSPAIGSITQPTCGLSTGSVVLNGLPSTGNWTLTKSPGGTLTTGSGTSSTISGLSAGTYTYTVSDASGCGSLPSNNVIINTQPETPLAPDIGPVTQPTCSVETGSVVLNGLPGTGNWTIARLPAGSTTSGSGISSTLSGLSAGTFTFSVTNEAGCNSIVSANVVISASISPATPAIGQVTVPTCLIPTGSVVLNSLPGTGTWTLTGPGGTITNGTGTSYTMTGLASGTYSYTVRNASGCFSASSANIVIPVLKPGVIPKIKTKWSGSILVCSNKSDSITSYQWYNGNSPIANATGQYYAANRQSGIYKVETTDKKSCKNFSNQISIAGTKSLTLYPNPASVDFSLKLDDEAEGIALISIINSSGIKVMEFEAEVVKNELLKTIPVSNLDKGIYIVNVKFRNEEPYSAKVIIAK